MRIGICIPFYYNSEEAKQRCIYLLETIKEQNFPVFCDVVVVVDGNNQDFLNEYNGKEGIRVIALGTHKGVSAARNLGIDYLQNERKCNYIGFIDADDSISGDYIVSAYEACEDNEYDIIDARFIQNTEIFGTIDDNERQKTMLRNGVAGTFIKSSVIDFRRFNELLKIGEDSDFINRVIDLETHKKGLFKGIYVYNYGANPNSITMRAAQNRLHD